MQASNKNNLNYLLVLVAALGYFVDIYDLILFSVVRVPSLKSLGLSDAAIMDKGVLLLNLQMAGMLLGGIFFGVLGDKLGRLSTLFGSILLYSIANIANGLVHDVSLYAVLRFVAGFGLAGELGAGITLVSETLPKEKRGVGTTIVASVGVAGALWAWFVTSQFQWRAAYFVGGGMGILLLLMRLGVFESSLYKKVEQSTVERGNFFMIFRKKERWMRFMGCVLMGVPVWYVVGILVTLSPEFGKALQVQGNVEGGKAIFYCYAGLIGGNLLSGFLSEWLKSRKKSVAVFLVLACAGILIYFASSGLSLPLFYWLCALLGLSTGYWAVFAVVSAEQFGTNLRATVATSSPNFVRGSLVVMSAIFLALKPRVGIIPAGLGLGVVVMALSFYGLSILQESFGTNLDFEEN